MSERRVAVRADLAQVAAASPLSSPWAEYAVAVPRRKNSSLRYPKLASGNDTLGNPIGPGTGPSIVRLAVNVDLHAFLTRFERVPRCARAARPSTADRGFHKICGLNGY